MLQDIFDIDIFEEEKKELEKEWRIKLLKKDKEWQIKLETSEAQISKIKEEILRIKEDTLRIKEDTLRIKEENLELLRQTKIKEQQHTEAVFNLLLKKFPDIPYAYYQKIKKADTNILDTVSVEIIDMNDYKQLDKYLN